MTDDQKIDRIINRWRKTLCMDDWDIAWEWHDGLGHDAECHPFPAEHRMKLLFNRCILGYSEKERNETVGHEMLHGTLAPIDKMLEPWAEAYLPPAALPIFAEALNGTENYVIEKLIRILRRISGSE